MQNIFSQQWRDADAYRFTEQLSVRQWIWEFLRRNPAYQEDWQWFMPRWQALEQAYGRPPERDFQAWKQDPRAYLTVDDAGGECRVDQDKVLIECWMGEKWGFYKFPLDPATNNPVSEVQLTWRQPVLVPVCVAATDMDYLGQRSDCVALGFQLNNQLKEQIETAKRYLQAQQSKRRRQGQIAIQKRSELAKEWCLMLRYLDGINGQHKLADLKKSLLEDANTEPDWDRVVAEAQQLVSGGHRSLLQVIDD